MKLNAVVCLSIALIPLFDQGSTSVGFEPVGLWNHLFMFRTKSRLCLWLGAGLLLMTIIWLKGHNRATNSEVGSYSHFRDGLQVNCLKVCIVAGLASSRQQLLEEFFDFVWKLASIFVSLLELSTKVSWMNTFNASLMALQY